MNRPSVLVSGDAVDIKLKKYYVYALIDSRFQDDPTLGIFYIGKGTNKRVLDHVKSVNAQNDSYDTSEEVNSVGDSKEKTQDDAQESSKVRRINEIQSIEGAKVIECILGRFDTASEAFAVEAVLIDWVYGREKHQGILTNIQAGRYSQHIRPRGNLGQNKFLDIPLRIKIESSSGDGSYSDRSLSRLLQQHIPEKADLAISQLRSWVSDDDDLRGLVTISDPVIVESGRYVGAQVHFGEDDVILRLQFTPRSLVTNLRASEEGRKASRDRFADRMRAVGLMPVGGNHYGWLPGWANNGLALDDCLQAIERIRAAARHFGHL